MKKKQLLDDNEFLKNNIQEIERIVENNDSFRKLYIIKLLFAIIVFVASIVFMVYITISSGGNWFMIGIIGIIISSMIIIVTNNKYKLGFKDFVVKAIIKKYDSKLEYFPDQGLEREEYDLCKFREKCDNYNSDDLIINQSTGFKCADLLIKSEYDDSENRTITKETFKGSIAKIDINNCHCDIYLGSVRKNVFSKDDYHSIRFENDEFNNLFAPCTNDELNARKLLTPDILEQLINIKKNAFGDIDIRILNDKLYIRFSSSDGFAPNLLCKKREIKSIVSSIAVLDEIIKTVDITKNIINSKNI